MTIPIVNPRPQHVASGIHNIQAVVHPTFPGP